MGEHRDTHAHADIRTIFENIRCSIFVEVLIKAIFTKWTKRTLLTRVLEIPEAHLEGREAAAYIENLPAWNPCHAFFVGLCNSFLLWVAMFPKPGGRYYESAWLPAHRAFLYVAGLDLVPLVTPLTNALTQMNEYPRQMLKSLTVTQKIWLQPAIAPSSVQGLDARYGGVKTHRASRR